MMRQCLCLGSVMVVVMAALYVPCVAQQGAATAPSTAGTAPAGLTPKIRIDEKVYDFGEIWEGDKVEHDFVVANDGKGVLEIISVRAGCGCTATQSDKTIEPGKSGKVHVSFNTKGKGSTPKTIVYIQTNDPVNARIDVRMEGKAKQQIEISPRGGVYFGRVVNNEIEPVTVKIVSNLPEPMKPEFKPLPGHENLFKITLNEIKPGKEYELTVSPQPPFPEGAINMVMVLKTGLKEKPTLNIPLNLYVPPAVEVTPGTIVLGAPPARDLPRPIDVTFNGPGQMKLLSAKSSDAAIKTSILEQSPGRRFRVLCQFPAGYNILNDQKVEIKLETDYAAKKEISVPVTMRMLPTNRAQQQAASRPAAAAIPDKPSLDMSVMHLDLGQRKPSETGTQDIYFRNGGSKPLEITKVSGSPGVTIEPAYTKTVAPGAAGMITAKYTVPEQPGPFAFKVMIESNDKNRSVVPVSLTGVTRSYIEVRPPNGADFGRRVEAHAYPRVVKLDYNGEGKIKYLKAESSSPRFEVSLEQIEDTGLGRLRITAKPPFDNGENTAVIKVTTDCPLQRVVEVPVNLVMPPRVEMDPVQIACINNNPHLLKRNVILRNNGKTPLHILAVEPSNDKLLTQFFPSKDGLSYQLQVTIPQNFIASDKGEKIVVRTDDPEYKELTVALVFRESPAAFSRQRAGH